MSLPLIHIDDAKQFSRYADSLATGNEIEAYGFVTDIMIARVRKGEPAFLCTNNGSPVVRVEILAVTPDPDEFGMVTVRVKRHYWPWEEKNDAE